jgi:hypothetical protein
MAGRAEASSALDGTQALRNNASSRENGGKLLPDERRTE